MKRGYEEKPSPQKIKNQELRNVYFKKRVEKLSRLLGDALDEVEYIEESNKN